ncbi:phage head-tail joining protein [Rhodobacter capsulatus]|uniref:phage head-tail joining protein n=1 Tax=Rhodobacter capsulatus TaxID=1061 RepID=UPI004024FD19
MALTTTELETMRDALIRARASGVRVTQFDGKRVEYANDAEMAKAIADLETRIRTASAPRPGSITFATSKGM